MSDLVERLRQGEDSIDAACVAMGEAADEIERLEAENVKLKSERDEWKAKWEAMASASLIAGTLRLQALEQKE